MAKINWIKAKRYYLSDEEVSYANVADEFGVSKTAVKERARKENWQKLALPKGLIPQPRTRVWGEPKRYENLI